jgi:threonyl-tRNA synthetase
MLVTGDREAAEGTVSVRSRSAGDQGARTVEAFVAAAKEEIEMKAPGAAAPAEKQPA